jgi:hypothetical protein
MSKSSERNRTTYETDITDKWIMYKEKLPTPIMLYYHKKYELAKGQGDDEKMFFWLGKADEKFNRFTRLGIEIEPYGKGIVVRGNTKPFKVKLQEIGGKWNKKLTNKETGEKFGGWIFSGSKRGEVIENIFPPDVSDVFSDASDDASDDASEEGGDIVPLKDAVWAILRIQFPDILSVNFDSSSVLIVGEVQSGKSEFSFALLIWKLLNGSGAVMVLRNYTKDAIHMMAKIDRFSSWLRGELEEHYPTTYIPKYLFEGVYVPDFLNKKKDKDGYYTVNGMEVGIEYLMCGYRVILAICNPGQLYMMNALMGGYYGNFALVIDEADALGYSEPNEESNLNAAAELGYLCESASNRYEISGTVMDVMVLNPELKGVDIIKIRPSRSYKSIKDVEYIAFKNEIGKSDGDFESSDPNMLEFYDSLKKESVFEAEKYLMKVDHPNIVLHKTSDRIEHHHAFLKWMKDKDLGWTVITECSKKKEFAGLRMYDSRLVGEAIIFKGKKIIADEEGIINFPESAIVPEVLQWMYDNGGASFFPHVVIKSGRFSGRSRSYVSSNGEWHLTHQYYSGAKDVPSLIQEQRLLHNRPDTIRLKCYAPAGVCKDILKGYHQHQEAVDRMTKEIAHDKLTHEYIAEQKWNRGKKPSVSVVSHNKKSRGFKLDTIENSEDDGGVKFGVYKKILSGIKRVDGGNVGWTRGDDGRMTSGVHLKDLKKKIEKYVEKNGNGWHVAKYWEGQLGLCGYSKSDGFHQAIDGTLCGQGYMEKRVGGKGVLEFRMKK